MLVPVTPAPFTVNSLISIPLYIPRLVGAKVLASGSNGIPPALKFTLYL